MIPIMFHVYGTRDEFRRNTAQAEIARTCLLLKQKITWRWERIDWKYAHWSNEWTDNTNVPNSNATFVPASSEMTECKMKNSVGNK